MSLGTFAMSRGIPGGRSPRRRSPRHRLAVALVAGTLALTGCGYDPGTVGDQPKAPGSAPSVDDADVAKQRAAHLVADAGELLRVAEHIQTDGAVSGPAKSVAGELRGILEMQTARLSADGGAAMMTGEEMSSVLDASGPEAEAAFADLLRTHLPRLRNGWAELRGAGDPAIADVAAESTARIEALIPKLDQLPAR